MECEGGQQNADSVPAHPPHLSFPQARLPDRALATYRSMRDAGLHPNRVTACAVATELSRAASRGARGGAAPALARAALAVWTDDVQTDPVWVTDATAVVVGMNAAAEAGEGGRARAILDAARVAPTAAMVNVLIKAAPDPATLATVLADAAAWRVPANDVTANSIVAAHARFGALASARSALDAALAAGGGRDGWAHAALGAAYVKAGRQDDAEALIEECERVGARAHVSLWSALVDGAARAGNAPRAAALVGRMQAAGVPPNAVTFNALLRAHCTPVAATTTPPTTPRPSALAGVLTTLAAMGDAGVRPGIDTYNTLMGGALARGAPAAVPRLFRCALRAGATPDALSWTTLVAALGRLGRADDAVAAFARYEAAGDAVAPVDGAALAALVDALARAGALARARSPLRRAAALAAAAGAPPPSPAYGAAVAGAARSGDAVGAASLVAEFAAAGGTPDEGMLAALASASSRSEREVRAAVAALRSAATGAPPRVRRELSSAARVVVTAAEAGAAQRGAGLERIKWWLGLPNRLYESDEDGSGESVAPGEEPVV